MSSDSPLLLDCLELRDLSLTWLTLFLLLLYLSRWHLNVALDWLLSIEFVHLSIRLRHHLRGIGWAPVAASGGLLLDGSLH